MTRPLGLALEDAFQDIRCRPLPMVERLRLIAEFVRENGPEFMDAVDAFVARLEAAHAGENAPQVGDTMPDFLLPDQDGHLVSLSGVLEQGPAVLVFHRGHWCTYCRINMAAVAEIEDQVAPARLLGISAETQAYTRRLRTEAGASFPFLSDVGGGYALSIGLAIWVEESMAAMIETAGWDIPSYQAGGGWLLPIPSVFVVARDGTIAARHVDPDYRRRMDLDRLVEAVSLVREGG